MFEQKTRFGFAFRNGMGSPDYIFFSFNLHLHAEDDGNDCPFRFGAELVFLNYAVAFGKWFV